MKNGGDTDAGEDWTVTVLTIGFKSLVKPWRFKSSSEFTGAVGWHTKLVQIIPAGK